MLNPRVDFAFKKLFGSEENKDILISLINSIVSEADQVVDVNIMNPYNDKSYPKDKTSILDIKAIAKDGNTFDVKGVYHSGNIIHLKAVNPNGDFYGIEAISPKGWINDVRGIKMFDSPVEATINGVEIFAHIKSIPQLE